MLLLSSCCVLLQRDEEVNNRHPRFVTCCAQEEHDGVTCEAYALSRDSDHLFRTWRAENDIRECPKCKEGIQKNGGCNHMCCAKCKAHICWYCMATFAEGGECYAHMLRVHGGHTPGMR